MKQSVTHLFLFAAFTFANAVDDVSNTTNQAQTDIVQVLEWNSILDQLSRVNLTFSHWLDQAHRLVEQGAFCNKPVTLTSSSPSSMVNENVVSFSYRDITTGEEKQISPFTFESQQLKDQIGQPFVIHLKSPFFEKLGIECSAVFTRNDCPEDSKRTVEVALMLKAHESKLENLMQQYRINI